MSGGPFCSRALWNLSGRLHCVLCRSVSGARLWNSRSLAVKHDRHAHEERKRDETRRTGGRIYMDPPLYARSLYRHPHHHGKKSATLTVSNASGLERTLKGNLFFQFSRVPRLWVRRRERDRDILRLKNADVSFFQFPKARSLEFLSPRRFPFFLPINFLLLFLRTLDTERPGEKSSGEARGQREREKCRRAVERKLPKRNTWLILPVAYACLKD